MEGIDLVFKNSWLNRRLIVLGMRHWTKKTTKFNEAKEIKFKKGPEGWYYGYSALIWYSRKYGGNPISDFKELDDRRNQLDKELQQLVYSTEALKILGSHIHSLELDSNIERRMISELYSLFGQIGDKIQNRKNVVGLDLEFVDAACVEWKKREEEKSRIKVDSSIGK
jgi:hypothetical protein